MGSPHSFEASIQDSPEEAATAETGTLYDVAEAIKCAGASGQVQSLVRALGALEELSRHCDGLTLTALAEAVGLPRSTTHRLLTTMDAMQFVMFDAKSNIWRIGPRAFSVGSAFGGARVISRLGKPFVSALHYQCEETVNIVILEAQNQLYIGQNSTRLVTPFQLREGDRLPAHYGAAGKSMMAFWNEHELDNHLRVCDFTRRTGKSNTDVGCLREKLKIVKERGFAFDCEESMADLRCVGAPVFDHSGTPVAAISISAPLNRMPKSRMYMLGEKVKQAALGVTQSLAGQPPKHLH